MLIWGETMRSKQQNKKGDRDLEAPQWGAVPLERVSLSGEDTKRSAFLRFCAGLNMLTSLAMLGVVCVNFYFSLFPCNSFIGNRLGLMFTPAALADLPVGVVRVFSVLFAVLVIFSETENSMITKNFSFLDSWVLRGCFVIFLGSLQLLTRIPCELMLHFRMNQTVGLLSVFLGVIYLLLGLLCFRQLRNRMMDHIRKKKQQELSAQLLLTQRGEIDNLLSETQKRLLS